MTDFEQRQVVVLSQGYASSKEERVCEITGELIESGEIHYSLGIVDRYHGQKRRIHVSRDVGDALQSESDWLRPWLHENRIIEDEYTLSG